MNSQNSAYSDIGILSVNDFCKWASIGRTAVYAEMKAGRLTARKFGRKTMIPLSEAQRWLSALPIVHSAAH